LSKKRPGITRGLIDGLKLDALVKAIDPLLQSIADRARLTADAVQNAFNRIAQLRNKGALTDREAERATNDARAVEAASVKQQIEAIENQRAALERSILAEAAAKGMSVETANAMLHQNVTFKQSENELDSLTLKYQELSTVIDSTARTINEALEGGLANAFSNFANGAQQNLFKAVKTFAQDFTKVINDVIAKDLAQDFVKNFLGGGGNGGIGGFFSSLFNPQGVGGKTPLIDKDLLGRDAGHAMFVKLADGQDALVNPKEAQNAFGPTPNGEGLKASDFSGFADDATKDVETAKTSADGILANASRVFEQGGLPGLASAGFGILRKGIVDGVASLTGDGKGDSLGFGKLATSIKSGLGGMFSSLSDFTSDLFSSLGDSLSKLGSSLVDSLSSSFSGEGGSDSGGGGLGALIASFFQFHTGGVVGEGAVQRSISPLVFANAIRYHSGGIAGLAPDEVPSILRRGEEVLTADNPRHRNNGGGSNTTVQMTIVTPDANSFRKSQDQLAAQTGAAVSRAIKRNR
jgi:uncharacterized membrane protein YgcG